MNDVEDFKVSLQRHFSDGLAIVVGSGLSAGEGISGMGGLLSHFDEVFPRRLGDKANQEWNSLSPIAHEKGLEAALMEREPSDELDAAIVHAICEKLLPEEHAVLEEVISGQRQLRFSRLVDHLPKSEKGTPILTTNYDRLIEVACEVSGLALDTMFDGDVVGKPDSTESRNNLLRTAGIHGRTVRMRRRNHARIFKPHGSFDWYDGPEGPLRFSGDLNLARLVVSPGRRKLRKGYDRPFDEHREAMNKCMAEAARLLVIGYGFNDDHLETHLSQVIQRGAPTLILTRTLSENSEVIARNHGNVIAIDRLDDCQCRIFRNGSAEAVAMEPIWDLETFVQEILCP